MWYQNEGTDVSNLFKLLKIEFGLIRLKVRAKVGQRSIKSFYYDQQLSFKLFHVWYQNKGVDECNIIKNQDSQHSNSEKG